MVASKWGVPETHRVESKERGKYDYPQEMGERIRHVSKVSESDFDARNRMSKNAPQKGEILRQSRNVPCSLNLHAPRMGEGTV